MKQTKYSKEVGILVLFNAIFVIVGLVLLPILDPSILSKNIILGIFAVLDAGFFLRMILGPGKIDKASGTLLLTSFGAAFMIVFKWLEGLL